MFAVRLHRPEVPTGGLQHSDQNGCRRVSEHNQKHKDHAGPATAAGDVVSRFVVPNVPEIYSLCSLECVVRSESDYHGITTFLMEYTIFRPVSVLLS